MVGLVVAIVSHFLGNKDKFFLRREKIIIWEDIRSIIIKQKIKLLIMLNRITMF